MKLWNAMKLLDENQTDVYEAKMNEGWKARMTVKDGFGGYYDFEVFKGKSLIDSSLGGGEFNGNAALNLDWQLVRQPVTWHEAIQAWVDGKTISYSYMGYDKRFPFEDSNTMMTIEKVKNAEWYVED